MKITTWNVNSLNVRLPQVQNLLADNPPDVLVLQELKLDQDKFPAAALQMMGWHCVWSGQKTYNGVAIISRSVPALPTKLRPGSNTSDCGRPAKSVCTAAAYAAKSGLCSF